MGATPTRPVRGLVSCVLALAGVTACSPAGSPGASPEGNQALRREAARLAHALFIADTHVDLPYRLQRQDEDVTVRTEGGDFDLVRAKEGGLDLAFMSIYVPASYQDTGGAKAFADSLIDEMEALAARAPERVAPAVSPAEALENFRKGVFSLALGIENGAALEGELGNLAHFHRRGVRYITLTHSENNDLCDSSYAREPRWHGLSPLGRQAVREMNRLGIMVDVSHVSDQAFDQILEVSQAPVIASHSSCRRFTPGFERNLDDDRIRAMAARGGVIHINFGSSFLVGEAQRQSAEARRIIRRRVEAAGVDPDSAEAREIAEAYWREHPRIYADVRDVAAHIRHVVEIAGVEHVGLGSDFEGVGDSLPNGLKDVSQIPNLIAELLQLGFDEESLRKILGGNTLRVWRDVEAVAARLQEEGP